MLQTSNLTEEVKFNNHYLVTYKNNSDMGIGSYLLISIAVTVYSRVFMSEFENRDDITLYYSDTDSIFIDQYLPEDVVNNTTLENWKLEDEHNYGLLKMKLLNTVN